MKRVARFDNFYLAQYAMLILRNRYVNGYLKLYNGHYAVEWWENYE